MCSRLGIDADAMVGWDGKRDGNLERNHLSLFMSFSRLGRLAKGGGSVRAGVEGLGD